jgi:uncharacterized membrane protein YfcA
MKPFYQSKVVSFGLFATLLGSLSPNAARAGSTIFETNLNDSTVGAYTTAGATLNAALISGLNEPTGIAVSGSHLFVANATTGTIAEYTTSGTLVNAALITGLDNPSGIALSGSHLFVANANDSGTIGEYTTSGAPVNPMLISGLNNPRSIAVVGDDLFVVNEGANTIGEYTTSGAPVNPSLISGLSTPFGIAVAGANIFVTNAAIGTVGEYTTSGAPVNPALISGLGLPEGIAALGSNLFVVDFKANTIGEYTTSGAPVNPTLISGLNGPQDLALVPEASTWVMTLTGFAALGFAGFRRARPRAASDLAACWSRPLLWNLCDGWDFSFRSMGLPEGSEMFFPGYEATMLALEANSVIGLRLIKIAHGGVDAVQEVHLMVQEKVEAGAEAMATLAGGGGVEAVLAGYRRRVAFNAQRLSPGSAQYQSFLRTSALALVSRAPSYVLRGGSYE